MFCRKTELVLSTERVEKNALRRDIFIKIIRKKYKRFVTKQLVLSQCNLAFATKRSCFVTEQNLFKTFLSASYCFDLAK